VIVPGEHGLRAVVKRLRTWTLFTSLWSTIVGAKGLPGPFILDKGKPVERPERKATGRDGCSSVRKPGCRKNVAAFFEGNEARIH
jgi:hypothetical protein